MPFCFLFLVLQVSTEGRRGEHSGRKNQASVRYPVCIWGSRISQKEADWEKGVCMSFFSSLRIHYYRRAFLVPLSVPPTLPPSLSPSLHLSPSSSSFFHLSQAPSLSLPPFLSHIHSFGFLLSLLLSSHVGECGRWLHQTSAGHFPWENLLYCNQGGHVSCHGNKH